MLLLGDERGPLDRGAAHMEVLTAAWVASARGAKGDNVLPFAPGLDEESLVPAALVHGMRELLPGARDCDSDEEVTAAAWRADDRHSGEEIRTNFLDDLPPLVKGRRLLEIDYHETARDLSADDPDPQTRSEGSKDFVPSHAPGLVTLPLANRRSLCSIRTDRKDREAGLGVAECGFAGGHHRRVSLVVVARPALPS